MLDNVSATSVLAVAAGSGLGFLVATIGGGILVLSVFILRYLFGLKNIGMLFGTSTALTAVMAIALVGMRRHAVSKTWRPAVWFTLPGWVGMAIGHMAQQSLSPHLRLALLGLVMLVNAALTFILPKHTGDAKTPAARLGIAGLIVGAVAGFFGGGGGFLVFPAMIWTGLPAASAAGSGLLSVVALTLTATVRNLGRCAIDWHLVPFYLAGAFAGIWSGVRLRPWKAKELSTVHLQWIAGSIMLVGGLYLMQHNWASLYRPSIALYDGVKGGIDYELTN